MAWYVISARDHVNALVGSFPFHVGREQVGRDSLVIDDTTLSRHQFTLEKKISGVFFVNRSSTDPGELDGFFVTSPVRLDAGVPHVFKVGTAMVGIGTNLQMLLARLDCEQKAAPQPVVEEPVPVPSPVPESPEEDTFYAQIGAGVMGPIGAEELIRDCEFDIIHRDTPVWYARDPNRRYRADEIVDYGPEPVPYVPEQSPAPVQQPAPQPVLPPSSVLAQTNTPQVRVTAGSDETPVEIGENFKCPYCRAVSDLDDVLSIAVSPTLIGDPVLGPEELQRFLPTQFTANGLAIDSEGGVCHEIACPRCHMALPQPLLSVPQCVMSVVGAAGAGKSFYLASGIWRCRQLLRKLFKINFVDLDPKYNLWIRNYEEKLFFQQDTQALQQIEKTDLQASNISRSVRLDGDQVLLPMPSFFKIQRVGAAEQESFVVYDCAGEHFRPGADVHSSLVTLHTLTADTLLFLFDPSADPRFLDQLDMGMGTAHNYAQMQDFLLSELAAKAKKHLGARGRSKLDMPLIFGISKADMLRAYLPLDAPIYRQMDDGTYALDLSALREVSRQVETYLESIAPEVTAVAHDIADDVWFMPISALGHNPMRDGVRPCDIQPIWTELPVVFTLARRGFVRTFGSWE